MSGTTPAGMCRLGSLRVLALVACLTTLACGLPAVPAAAVQTSQPTPVSVVPGTNTPAVNDGAVYTIAKVGSRMVLGGTFHSASALDDPSAVLDQRYALAFDAATGALDGGFRPRVNGTVTTVAKGPRHGEVYIGGWFSRIDGRAWRLALVDAATGRVVHGWHSPHLNGVVDKVLYTHHRLYVGGGFTKVGKHRHAGLVALDPKTGRVSSYVDLAFTGHHNYGRHCHPSPTCVPGHTGARNFDVNPAGTRMVVVGDFTHVGRRARDQVAMLDLRRKHLVLDRGWKTKAYTAECLAKSFDSYIRDVQFSPSGSYFVIAASGGHGVNSDGTNSSCDSAARFDTHRYGADVRPVWIDYSGDDSLWTVAITGSAVYVGGHERWLNNSYGHDFPGPGAVPRPGIAALDPTTGLPLSWNPGRNPRGGGCYALLATPQGLWAGSDTAYIGNQAYLRPRIAFFPLAGGEAVPPAASANVPGTVYEVGATASDAPDPDRLASRSFDGHSAGPEQTLATGLPWSDTRGAFFVDGELVYGRSDGNLYERSFDGTSLGPETELDPYDDPTWSSVQTGSGQTYQGTTSGFVNEVPFVTSMFFTNGRLYYTTASSPALRWRWFEPDDGVVSAQRYTVHGAYQYLADVSGAFLAGARLYFADQATGVLESVGWTGTKPVGTPTVVDLSTDWPSRGLFLMS